MTGVMLYAEDGLATILRSKLFKSEFWAVKPHSKYVAEGICLCF